MRGPLASAPPAHARYRCGFPGCFRRYASTDGVRKHARKAHSEWLRQVDQTSVLRDKSYESKPSTYCIMEEGEGEECEEIMPTEHHAADDDSERTAPDDDLPGFAAAEDRPEQPACLTTEESLMGSDESARMPLDHDGFGMNRPLSIPSALDLHASVMASVAGPTLTATAVLKGASAAGSREAWASSIAMQLLSNQASLDVDPELATLGDPLCFTPPMLAYASDGRTLPIYYSPGREGKLVSREGMSPFSLEPAVNWVKQGRLGSELPPTHDELGSSPTPDAEPSSELPNMNEAECDAFLSNLLVE